MQDLYAETVSAVNFSNGVVRMILVDQDPSALVEGNADPAKAAARFKQQVIMPLPGFLYMLTVIRGLVEDPKMQEMLSKYTELGLLPARPEDGGSAESSRVKEDAAVA